MKFLLHHAEAVDPDLINSILEWIDHVFGIQSKSFGSIVFALIIFIPVLIFVGSRFFNKP
tara:strand:- start:4802 stop:4981 length:180 start_codon:yes stop_codon:yes gene_type:complete